MTAGAHRRLEATVAAVAAGCPGPSSAMGPHKTNRNYEVYQHHHGLGLHAALCGVGIGRQSFAPHGRGPCGPCGHRCCRSPFRLANSFFRAQRPPRVLPYHSVVVRRQCAEHGGRRVGQPHRGFRLVAMGGLQGRSLAAQPKILLACACQDQRRRRRVERAVVVVDGPHVARKLAGTMDRARLAAARRRCRAPQPHGGALLPQGVPGRQGGREPRHHPHFRTGQLRPLHQRQAGTDVLTPVPTDYTKTVAYDTYDVTSLIAGRNAVGVALAPGHYFAQTQNY